MSKRALITGITSQDGTYLAEFLLEQGYEVTGVVRANNIGNLNSIAHIQDKVTFVVGDLLDQISLTNILDDHRPHEVYNLASHSFGKDSWNSPVFVGEVTALGVSRLLDAIRTVDPDIRFFQASCHEIFGRGCEVPQTEHTLIHPSNPYAVAKAYGYWITVSYRESFAMFTSNGILFSHESPRRDRRYVTRRIAHGVVRIKLGLEEKLRLDGLDSQHDWGYAPDYVKAMWMMLQQEQPDDYIVATGHTHTVREFAQIAFDHLGLDYRNYVVEDESSLSSVDEGLFVGDPSRAQVVLGWKPTTTFEDLVRIMVEAELKHIRIDQ